MSARMALLGRWAVLRLSFVVLCFGNRVPLRSKKSVNLRNVMRTKVSGRFHPEFFMDRFKERANFKMKCEEEGPKTTFTRTRGRAGIFTFTPGDGESSTVIVSPDKRIPTLDHRHLLRRFEEEGIKTIHLSKLWGALIKNPSLNFADVPNLPKKAVMLLSNEFSPCTSKLVQSETSQDGLTTKLVIELQDKQLIESVIIQHENYAALCVSSQVGCRMGCKFCATGTMGLIRNLTAGEILEQVLIANTVKPIRNIVFMGMGEPLDNYDAVVDAIHGIHDTRMFNLGLSHITISTVGVVGSMYRLADEIPNVALAVSLHAPNQDLRLQIVPTSKFNSMDRILEAMDYYLDRSPHHSFIQYTVIKNINDKIEHALSLAQKLKNRRVKVNLIPYNPTGKEAFETPDSGTMESMKQTLLDEGLLCFIRDSTESGRDVSGACGQLALSTVEGRNSKIRR
mmetsp:Transcript_3246/g.4910  ORF Transcript_3246/g.4910 Transcript_3246/m.4910 type:complete len:453 (+) Transcript_3246:21-1379(+)